MRPHRRILLGMPRAFESVMPHDLTHIAYEGRSRAGLRSTWQTFTNDWEAGHPTHTADLRPAAGGPDADYSAFEGHDLHVVPSAATLTFEHSYTWWGNRRKLRVAAQPNVTLSAAHVPARCRRARTVLLGPLTPTDVDCLSFIQQPGTGSDLS